MVGWSYQKLKRKLLSDAAVPLWVKVKAVLRGIHIP
jgi:hypothetical protein